MVVKCIMQTSSFTVCLRPVLREFLLPLLLYFSPQKYLFLCLVCFLLISCCFLMYRFILQVDSGYVCEGDHKTMAKAIKDRVSLIKRKREQRQLVREEQEKRKQEESSLKQQGEQQSSASQAGAQQPPSTCTGGPAASTTSASVSTQVEPEEPEADQHQQLQHQPPGVSVLCESWGKRAGLLKRLLVDFLSSQSSFRTDLLVLK